MDNLNSKQLAMELQKKIDEECGDNTKKILIKTMFLVGILLGSNIIKCLEQKSWIDAADRFHESLKTLLLNNCGENDHV